MTKKWVATAVAASAIVASAVSWTCLGPAALAGEAPVPPAAIEAAAGPSPSEPNAVISITSTDAVLMALENNRALIVQRQSPRIQKAAEDIQRSAFDPNLTAQASFSRARATVPAVPTTVSVTGQGSTVQAAVAETFSTGTTASLGLATAFTNNSDPHEKAYRSQSALSVSQALLRGFGLGANLASLRQARIDTLSSEYQLRGFAEQLVASTEETYWNYALAQKQIEIFTQSLEIAQKQLSETRERIRVGILAEVELAAAEAEVALRQQDLINGRSSLATTKLALLRLISPPGPDPLGRDLDLRDEPSGPSEKLDPLDEHIKVGLMMRPDLNQARLQVKRGDLDVVKTKNGLLPNLDLFVTLGNTGYADSFGESIRNIDGRNYALTAGLSAEYPLGNRAARAGYTRSVLSRQQQYEAVDNLAQLVESDVRRAYIEVVRSGEQVVASAATRRLQEEKLRAETEKFRVGKSTTLLVGQAQRDLQSAQIAEIQAVISYRNAFVELYRLEGSLLQRRGVNTPGSEPISLEADYAANR